MTDVSGYVVAHRTWGLKEGLPFSEESTNRILPHLKSEYTEMSLNA
jgi:hypothetical protein